MTKLTDEQVLAEASALLQEIGHWTTLQRDALAKAEAEIAEIRLKYKLEDFAGCLSDLEKKLLNLMKKRPVAIFGTSDKKVLPAGVLSFGEEDQVKIPKTALAAIKEQGWVEAIRTIEEVKRDVVKAWPNERLAVIGAVRKPKRSYRYDLADKGK